MTDERLEEWARAVRLVADLVVQRDWQQLEERGLLDHPLTESSKIGLEEAMQSYPGTFVRIPDDAIARAVARTAREAEEDDDGVDWLFYDFDVPLHTLEEGATDLVMVVQVYERSGGVLGKLHDLLVR